VPGGISMEIKSCDISGQNPTAKKKEGEKRGFLL
jgi:hypothetical protein